MGFERLKHPTELNKFVASQFGKQCECGRLFLTPEGYDLHFTNGQHNEPLLWQPKRRHYGSRDRRTVETPFEPEEDQE